MSDGQWGDILPVKGFFQIINLTKLLLAKRSPKLGIQLPNDGDDNQSCHILMVIFNWIEQLLILQYNIYSSTLIYTNVTIATSLRVCVTADES